MHKQQKVSRNLHYFIFVIIYQSFHDNNDEKGGLQTVECHTANIRTHAYLLNTALSLSTQWSVFIDV